MKIQDLKPAVKKVLLTKKGEVSRNVINKLSHIHFNEERRKIYTGYYSGTGRYTSRHSSQGDVTMILNAHGYKYTTGNDSERGGASGEFVKCSIKAIEFIQAIKNL